MPRFIYSALPGPLVPVRIDGAEVRLPVGANLAAALQASGRVAAALYCRIGQCQACAVTIDGRHGLRACRVRVRAGLVVETAP